MAKSPSAQVASVPAQLMLVRTATCKKISSRASGSIEYRVAYAPDKSDVFISISANIGGGGYFSKEWIPASRIASCFAQLPGEQAIFATKQLRELFIGRSVNNPPFIAAVLRAEGLLAAAPENEVQHQLSGKLDEWRKNVLKQKGTPFDTLPVAEPAVEAAGNTTIPVEVQHVDHPQSG